MHKPKSIDEVNDFIQDDSWIQDAIKELEEEFERIDREGDKTKAPLASKARQNQPEV